MGKSRIPFPYVHDNLQAVAADGSEAVLAGLGIDSCGFDIVAVVLKSVLPLTVRRCQEYSAGGVTTG